VELSNFLYKLFGDINFNDLSPEEISQAISELFHAVSRIYQAAVENDNNAGICSLIGIWN
jgi:hypothetical protein